MLRRVVFSRFSSRFELKILQIISGRQVNGALVHCKLLTERLVRRGHDVTVMCRPDSWIWDQLNEINARVVLSEMNRWPLTELWRASRWVQREGFDVMHTHMSRAHAYGVLLRRLSGVPVVATAHNRYVQLHWRLNDRVIANSEATRQFHCRYNRVLQHKVSTIHCFVDLPRFAKLNPRSRMRMRRSWRVQEHQPVIGIVGDVVARKGHWYLFNSLPGLLRQFPDLLLVVTGRFKRNEPYVKKLRRYLLKHQLVGKVKWLGRRDNIPEIMSALDVLVVPSLEEPMGMVPLEAMAAGTPVIAARTGGLIEVVKHEVNGILVPVKDARSIETAVARLLSDAELGRAVSSRGLKWVHNQFSPPVLSEKIEQTLITACRQPRAA